MEEDSPSNKIGKLVKTCVNTAKEITFEHVNVNSKCCLL